MQKLIYALTRFEGRIGRGQFWLGAILVLGATILLSFIAYSLGFGVSTSETGYFVNSAGERADISQTRFTVTPWAGLIISALMTWPWIALGVKRRHDRDFSGYDMLGFTALGLFVQLLGVLGTSGFFPTALSIVWFVWAICLFILLGCLKGTVGDNKFGPDPLLVTPEPAKVPS